MTAYAGSETEVAHLGADVVRAAFDRGAVLAEAADHAIHAGRREGPGQAEIHALDTDIFHILEGRGTIVTGGEVVDAREIGPNEIRGEALRGGVERELAAGDVIVIPRGVPHCFVRIEQTMTYFVVKVSAK